MYSLMNLLESSNGVIFIPDFSNIGRNIETEMDRQIDTQISWWSHKPISCPLRKESRLVVYYSLFMK
jgi:hypothetical protein